MFSEEVTVNKLVEKINDLLSRFENSTSSIGMHL